MLTRSLILHSLPEGELLPEHFRVLDTELPDRPGLLLKPRYISVDPYMRTRMQPEGYAYIERWSAGSPLSAWTLAEVITSRDASFKPGDLVVGHLPMQESVASDGSGLTVIPASSEPTAFLHPLGMTGFTAWVGMQLLGQPTANDTVLVSAAAGAVGSMAAQLAKQSGATVIVTAGRADKRAWLRRHGFQTVLDHHHPHFAEQLKSAAPSGITLNFENVGGHVFKSAIDTMSAQGRIILCGLVSQYQSDQPRQSPENFVQLGQKRVSVHPFVVPHYMNHWADFQHFMAPLVARGHIHWQLDKVSGGLESIGPALIGLLRGDNLGKRVVEMP